MERVARTKLGLGNDKRLFELLLFLLLLAIRVAGASGSIHQKLGKGVGELALLHRSEILDGAGGAGKLLNSLHL